MIRGRDTLGQWAELGRACRQSRAALRPYREYVRSLIATVATGGYPTGLGRAKMPVNQLELAARILRRAMVSGKPRVLVQTPFANLRPSAHENELAVNHILDTIQWHQTLRTVVFNALFGMGILKTGINASQRIKVGGFWHDIGVSYSDGVSLDHWVHDTDATTYEACQFAGDRVCLTYDEAVGSGMYDNQALGQLNYGDDYGSPGEETRLAELSQTRRSGEPYKRRLWLWEIWDKASDQIVTFNNEFTAVVGVRPYQGPANGPYRLLRYNVLPDNILPASALGYLEELNRAINRLYSKIIAQASRQKTNVAYRGADVADTERLNRASDGQYVHMENPEGAKNISTGAFDQLGMSLAMHLKQLASYIGGNLDVLGGLGVEAPTASQEQQLSSSANMQIAEMQEITQEFVRDALTDMSWFVFYDPAVRIPLNKQVPQSDIQIPFLYNAARRQGDFVHYNFDVHPFSLKDQAPAAQLAQLGGLLQSIVLPMMQMGGAQQGVTLNARRVIEQAFRLSGLTSFGDIVEYAGPGDYGTDAPRGVENDRRDAGATEQLRLPKPATHSTTTRRSVSTKTQQGQDQVMMQALAGGAKEAA